MKFIASSLCFFISTFSATAQTSSQAEADNIFQTVIKAGSEYLKTQLQDEGMVKHFRLDSASLFNPKNNYSANNPPLYLFYFFVNEADTIGGATVSVTPELTIRPDRRTEAEIRGYKMLLTGELDTDYRTAIKIAQKNGVKKGRVGDSLTVNLNHYRWDYQYPVYTGEQYASLLKNRLKGEYYWEVQDYWCTKCASIIVDAADRNNFFPAVELWQGRRKRGK